MKLTIKKFQLEDMPYPGLCWCHECSEYDGERYPSGYEQRKINRRKQRLLKKIQKSKG